MQLITFILTLDYFLNMSVYRSSSNKYWKHSFGDIITALKAENHPDQEERFSLVACTLMMHNKPEYWRWLDTAIIKLINDSISQLNRYVKRCYVNFYFRYLFNYECHYLFLYVDISFYIRNYCM